MKHLIKDLTILTALAWIGCESPTAPTKEPEPPLPLPAVDDLAVGWVEDGIARLTWTAPSGTPTSGPIRDFEIRIAPDEATANAWSPATQIFFGLPDGSAAGASQSFELSGLSPGADYFFAIRVRYANDPQAPQTAVRLPGFADRPVDFPDAALDAAVRAALAIPAGDVLFSDCLQLNELPVPGIVFALDGLEACQNLTRLFIHHSRLTSLGTLSSLRRLNMLSVNEGSLTDLSGIAALAALNYFTLKDNDRPVDLTALSELPNLFGLALLGIPNVDMTLVGSLTTVVSLSFTFEAPGQLASLSNLPLQSLGVEGLPPSDLPLLAQFPDLRGLAVKDATYGDAELTAIATATDLTGLQMEGSQVTDLTPLKGEVTLMALRLYGNVSDLTPLQSLPDLEKLELPYHSVTDACPILDFPILGSGGYVDLVGNPLDANSIDVCIPLLESRGTIVNF